MKKVIDGNLSGMDYFAEHTRALSLFNVEAGLISNCRDIIYDDEYFLSEGKHLHSLLSNFKNLKEIPYTDRHDFYLFLVSGDRIPFSFKVSESSAYITGNFCQYERETGDKRLSIFGNMGLFSKLYLRMLEDRGIFSLHSTSFYNSDKNRLYIVIGGSGSGKSSVALAAIKRKLELFGAELTHFSMENGKVVFYKGPVNMNCRVGNIVKDFPELIKRFDIKNIPEGNVWHSYIPVYFGSVQTKAERFVDPELTIIYPRIEEERRNTVIEELSINEIKKALFDNMAEKISPPTLLYNKYFVPSIDTDLRSVRRMETAGQLCRLGEKWKVYRVLASPEHCLDGLI